MFKTYVSSGNVYDVLGATAYSGLRCFLHLTSSHAVAHDELQQITYRVGPVSIQIQNQYQNLSC